MARRTAENWRVDAIRFRSRQPSQIRVSGPASRAGATDHSPSKWGDRQRRLEARDVSSLPGVAHLRPLAMSAPQSLWERKQTFSNVD